MFEHSEKRLGDMMKFQAAIHGAEINDDELFDGGRTTESETVKPRKDKGSGIFKFGDPADYEHLPMEERERLTQQMMGQHKRWEKYKKPMGRGVGNG